MACRQQKSSSSSWCSHASPAGVTTLGLPVSRPAAPAVMEIDAVGTFTMSRAAFEALKQNSESVIINISATLHYGATWYQVHASAAKAAVDSITRSLALEWGEYGIRVNGVAPGPIRGTAGAPQAAVCESTYMWQMLYS